MDFKDTHHTGCILICSLVHPSSANLNVFLFGVWRVPEAFPMDIGDYTGTHPVRVHLRERAIHSYTTDF